MRVPLIPKEKWTAEIREEVGLLKGRFGQLVNVWQREIPVQLYHYTSSETMKKILLSRTIRLHDVFDMPDKEEFKYPNRAIWAALQPSYGKLILEVADLFNPGRRAGLDDALLPFVACFCEAEESEFMWRRYGDRFKGASITIRGQRLGARPGEHAVYPMVYNGAEFKEILGKFFQYLVGRDWIMRFDFAAGRTLALEACMLLIHFLVRMKRARFSPEGEWRALKLRWQGYAHQVDNKGRRFIDVPLLPRYLAGVTLGSKSTLQEKDITALLRAHFGKVPVLRSKLG